MPQIIPPGRTEKTLRTIGYLCVGIGTIVVFALPDGSSIQDGLGWLRIIWALFMLTSIPAAVAAAIGRYRIEYVCLPWFGGGYIMALLWAWIHIVSHPQTASRTCFFTALAFCYAVRFFTLRRLVKLELGEQKWTGTRPRP